MTSTEIKLTPAMDAALTSADIKWSPGFDRFVGVVLPETKAQTVKGLHTRGLTDADGFLTESGVEWARQLGAEFPPKGTTSDPEESIGFEFDKQTGVVDSKPVDAGLSAEQTKAVDQIAELLDTPQLVPNRSDKRKARFGLRAALSRLQERQKQRRIRKYGDTKFGQSLAA